MTTFKINDREVTKEEFFQSKEDGLYQSFYDNGQPRFDITYVNGNEHGLEKWWHEDGQLAYEYLFIHGQQRDINMPKLTQVILYGKEIRCQDN